MFDIREDDLAGEQTRELLALHLAGMHAASPPGSVYALDLSGLQTPDVTVWTAWLQGRVVAGRALKMLADGSGEVKSMRTHPDFTRKGAATALLETIIAAARARGARRLSLETGSGAAFEPALMLYRRRGFRNGAAFGGYPAERLQPVPAPRPRRRAAHHSRRRSVNVTSRRTRNPIASYSAIAARLSA